MIYSLIRSMRPRQWVKNLVVFAALVFDHKLGNPESLGRALSAFVIFCVICGGIYIINDVRDLAGDRRHPVKSKRPIASGVLPVGVALRFAIGLVAVGLAASVALGKYLAAAAAIYVVLSIAYSFLLKNIVIIDVMALGLGFVLRAAAGGFAIGATPSSWLLICSFLLALFLGFGKRRHELTLLEDAHEHRQILKEYSPYFLDQMMGVVTATTMVAYAAYTMDPATIEKLDTRNLIWTIPFVLYGIFRYLYLVHQKEEGGSPTNILLTDKPIMLTVLLWAAAVVVILYLV